MNSSNPFRGIICPLLTPYDQRGNVDAEKIKILADFLISKGIPCLMVGGSTGEAPLLSIAERMILAEALVSHVGKRATVIIHTGCNSTQETIDLSRHAQKIQASGISVITPSFFSFSDDELFDYYRTVAGAVPHMPISLYSYPDNAKHDITPGLVARLIKACANIRAIKVSNINLIRFQEYGVVSEGSDFSLLCGVDGLALPALTLGACGQVSGNSNVFPEPFVRLYEAYQSGNLAEAQHYQKTINIIRSILKDDIPHFKAAMLLRGIDVGTPRPPMRMVSDDEFEEMKMKVATVGLL
jgi:dihydrodipicolinate synthase/N-acetylneuraminate lyase